MKNKKLAKILVLILSVALICGALIMVVNADDTVDIGVDLAPTLTAAEAGSTVTLTEDSFVNSFALDKNLTIDLAGYTLTSTTSEAFSISTDVTLNIVGNGTLNLDGALVRVSGCTPKVNVTGGSSDIIIKHTGSKAINLVFTNNGDFSFTNVDVISTAAYNNATDAKNWIFYAGGSANWSFKNFDFRCDTADRKYWVSNNTVTYTDNSLGFIKVSSTGTLVMENSSVYTTGNGIHYEAASHASADVEFITIDNSTLSCIAKNGFARVVAFWGGWSGTTLGTISITDSLIEGSYNVIMGGKDTYEKTIYKFNNSVIMTANSNTRYKSGSDQGNILRGSKAIFDANSRIAFAWYAATNNGQIHVSEGTRLSKPVTMAGGINLYMPDGQKLVIATDGTITNNSTEYALAFDPVTDSNFPYVVVKLEEGKTAADYTTFTADKSYYLTMNDIYSATGSNTTDANKWKDCFANAGYFWIGRTTQANSSSGSRFAPGDIYGGVYTFTGAGNDTNIWHGALTDSDANGNTAYKYIVTPSVDDPTSPTHTFYKDTYMVLGNGRDTTYAPVNSESQAAVYVYDIDFATDSAVGYPTIGNFMISARKSNGGARSGPSGKVSADGKFTIGDKTYQLKPNGEWNHLTAVVYTSGTQGKSYYYLNGEQVASGTAYGTEATYLQGFYVQLNKSNPQTVGATMLFDNVAFRAYNSVSDDEMTTNTPDKYNWYNNSNKLKANASIVAGGKEYSSVNQAFAAADALGTAAFLLDDTIEELINTDGVVNANGYVVSAAEGSYGADIKYAKDGSIASYIFDSTYNDLTVTYKWYIGEPGGNMFDENNFDLTTVKVGQIPEHALTSNYLVTEGGDYLARKQVGWSHTGLETETVGEELTPVTIALAKEVASRDEYDRYEYLYPVYGEAQNYFYWVVLDEEGNFSRGGTQSNFYSGSETSGFKGVVKLAYGETFVICKDGFNFAGGMASLDADKLATGTESRFFNFDVNGHLVYFNPQGSTTKSPSSWTIYSGETLNVYSSREGGRIIALGYTGDKAAAGIMFQMNSAGSLKNMTNTEYLQAIKEMESDSHLNIGTVTVRGNTYPGSNLTFEGDTFVRLERADATCSANIDGITFIRTTSVESAVFMSKFSYATVNVTNSNFLMASGNALVSISGEGAVDADGTATTDKDKVVTKGETAYNFDNCVVITSGTGNVIGNNLGCKEIVFTNCIITGRLNPSHGSVTYVGENTAGENIDKFIDGYDDTISNVNYNVPMTLAGITDADTYTIHYYSHTGTSKTVSSYTKNSFVIAVNGYEGEADKVLPVLATKAIKTEDRITVTFKGYGSVEDKVVYYAPGGNVVSVGTLDVYDGAVKVTHDGTWAEELPQNITEDATLTPNVTVESNINGVLTNLSLYSDFNINLYIPVEYEEYITSVTDGTDVLETSPVTVNGAQYIKVTIEKSCEEATSDAVFYINVKDGEYNATATATIDIASYAEVILKDTELATYTAADRKLMYYMVNYANEAYKYFTDATADDEVLAKLLADYADAKGEGMTESNYDKAIEVLGVAAAIDEVTVKLDSAPEYVLILKDGFVGTVTVTYGENSRTFTVTETDRRTLVISDMKAYNFATRLTITASGKVNGEDVSVTEGAFNLDTFVKYHVENAKDESSATKADSEACLDLLLAFYDYVRMAEEYKASITVEA
ncbi:MAG: hypothetical protein E7617_01225 [Ruminococcaceae bacterium]|nr:hypothetical protein [Oscillospiraceae bacterium]